MPSQSLKDSYFRRGEQPWQEFEVALGDWGVSSWADNHLAELIQPLLLRSPEVLIQAPWDETTDWWNLGAVLLEVFRCVRMFYGLGPPAGEYDPRIHFAEMVAYFGPFPRSLLDKGDQELVKLVFDESGRVRGYEGVELPDLDSEVYMDDLDEENRKLFVQFLRALMKLDPEERKSGMELLSEPLLGVTIEPPASQHES